MGAPRKSQDFALGIVVNERSNACVVFVSALGVKLGGVLQLNF
ncbi:MAG: hypothetical protein ACO3NK_08570 [Prochlorotrichaceae cyanobacterium]